jgi:thiamine transport system permease protein
VISLQGERTPDGVLGTGFTLDFYRALTIEENQSLFYVPPITAVAISIGYALSTMFIALIIGLPAAWALSRNRNAKISRMIDPIFMLPLGTSAVTLGLGFIVALDQPPLDLRASPWLIPIAHTLVAFPFVVRSLIPALQSIQPRLHQAAMVLGASPQLVFRKIDLPLISRALMIAATFSFTISIGEFGATAMIARPEYPTIPMVIYRYLSRPGGLNYGQAMALSSLLMVVTILGMLMIEKLRIGEGSEF